MGINSRNSCTLNWEGKGVDFSTFVSLAGSATGERERKTEIEPRSSATQEAGGGGRRKVHFLPLAAQSTTHSVSHSDQKSKYRGRENSTLTSVSHTPFLLFLLFFSAGTAFVFFGEAAAAAATAATAAQTS